MLKARRQLAIRKLIHSNYYKLKNFVKHFIQQETQRWQVKTTA
jgi:hypothetical protein